MTIVRILAAIAIIFIAGAKTAQAIEPSQVIGTWWHPVLSEETEGTVIIRVRDDGYLTFRILSGSIQQDLIYVKWELNDDTFSYTPGRPYDDQPINETASYTAVLEGEALQLTAPDGTAIDTWLPGIPAEAIPQGHALHGKATYRGEYYTGISIIAYRYGAETPELGGTARLIGQGEWEILGLPDGRWALIAVAFGEEGEGAFHIGDVEVATPHEVIAASDTRDPYRLTLEGDSQAVTGIHFVLSDPAIAVETVTWADVKKLLQ